MLSDLISPGHAKVFAQHGWDKARIKRELFEHAYIPLTQVAAEPQLSHPHYGDWDRSRRIPLCRQAEDIVILVAGGPEAYHVTYIPSFGSTDMVIQAIDIP